MPRKKGFNNEKKQQALARVVQGHSYVAVGKEFGVAPDTIYRLAKDRGYAGRTVRGRGKSITVRLSDDEFAAFQAFAKAGEFKHTSDAIRALLRSTQGYLTCTGKTRAEFEDLKKKVEGIANNINQVAFAANRKNIALVREQWEDVEELRKGLNAYVRLLRDALAEMRGESVKLWKKSEYGDG